MITSDVVKGKAWTMDLRGQGHRCRAQDQGLKTKAKVWTFEAKAEAKAF